MSLSVYDRIAILENHPHDAFLSECVQTEIESPLVTAFPWLLDIDGHYLEDIIYRLWVARRAQRINTIFCN